MTNTGNLTSAMCLEYLAGRNCQEVGKLFGITGGSVGRRFKKIDFPLRAKSTPIRIAPVLGEIRGSKSLGKKHRGKYIFACCPECNEGHWIRLDEYKKKKEIYCKACSGIAIGQSNMGHTVSAETRCKISEKLRGERSNRWLGGKKRINPKYIKLSSDHKYSCMAQSGGYVLEHRIVMAEYMGRPLGTQEVVHHRNRDTRDNQIENLALLESQSEHVKLHSKEDYNNEMPKV